MRAHIRFSPSGQHSTLLHLYPQTDADDRWLAALDLSTGIVTLTIGGPCLEARYLPRDRLTMGQAYFEICVPRSAAATLIGISLWLPAATVLEVSPPIDEPIAAGDRALLAELRQRMDEVARRQAEREWCDLIDRTIAGDR